MLKQRHHLDKSVSNAINKQTLARSVKAHFRTNIKHNLDCKIYTLNIIKFKFPYK